jgi:hypothetical protein
LLAFLGFLLQNPCKPIYPYLSRYWQMKGAKSLEDALKKKDPRRNDGGG